MRKITRIVVCFFASILLLPLGAYAGNTVHTVPGVNFQPFIFAQATKLERSHVRISNPITNTNSYWVVGGIQRVAEDIDATTDPPAGYIFGFFNSGATEDIVCAVREFNWPTTEIPGVSLDPTNTLNAVAATIPLPGSLPNVSYASFNFPVDTQYYAYNFLTVVCKLPPGTGINSIGILQR